MSDFNLMKLYNLKKRLLVEYKEDSEYLNSIINTIEECYLLEKNKVDSNLKLTKTKKIICNCGSLISCGNIKKHKKTNKHIDYLKLQTEMT